MEKSEPVLPNSEAVDGVIKVLKNLGSTAVNQSAQSIYIATLARNGYPFWP